MRDKLEVSRFLLAGFAATCAMTLLMLVSPWFGMPRMDPGAMLGVLFGRSPAPGSGAWFMGVLFYIINGSVFLPLIYGHLLCPLLPGEPWMKGAAWGLLLWYLSEAFVGPLMGWGFFGSRSPQPALAVIGSLAGHLAYGALLGEIAGVTTRRPARVEEVEYRRAA